MYNPPSPPQTARAQPVEAHANPPPAYNVPAVEYELEAYGIGSDNGNCSSDSEYSDEEVEGGDNNTSGAIIFTQHDKHSDALEHILRMEFSSQAEREEYYAQYINSFVLPHNGA
jgi:hypothetical protein